MVVRISPQDLNGGLGFFIRSAWWLVVLYRICMMVWESSKDLNGVYRNLYMICTVVRDSPQDLRDD